MSDLDDLIEFCKNIDFNFLNPILAEDLHHMARNSQKELAKLRESVQQPSIDDLCDCGEPFPEKGCCEFCGARQRY